MKKEKTICVEITDKDSVNWALKSFKRKCETFGVIKEYRKRKSYQKPSERRKEKKERAVKRRVKDLKRRRVYSKI